MKYTQSLWCLNTCLLVSGDQGHSCGFTILWEVIAWFVGIAHIINIGIVVSSKALGIMSFTGTQFLFQGFFGKHQDDLQY